MTEIKLDQAVEEKPEEKRRLFAIKNEKGQYLKNSGTYWTSDLNKVIPNLRNERTQIDAARNLLKTKEEYLSGKYNCLNQDLYLGFEKLYIQEVTVVEVN